MCPALDLESLKLIQDTASKAAGVDVKNRVCVRADLPDKTKWLLIDKDGDSEMLDVSEPARSHKLLSVQEVVAFAIHAANDENGLTSKPVVWIGAEKIIVTLDDRRLFGDRAVYDFCTTDEWDLLEQLSKANDGLDQKAMLKLLRVRLAESFANDESRRNLIVQLRKVRMQQQSAVGNGSGSYEATVGGNLDLNEWPENLDLSIRVFNDPALTVRKPIRCAFEVEPLPVRFCINPLTAHLTRALNETLELTSETIRASLKETAIPVFLGQPE